MLEIRIDAMVRRIGSNPPGTSSIVSFSIRLLPFLFVDNSGAHYLVGLEDCVPHPMAPVRQRHCYANDGHRGHPATATIQ
jgi:hypothetical protein